MIAYDNTMTDVICDNIYECIQVNVTVIVNSTS